MDDMTGAIYQDPMAAPMEPMATMTAPEPPPETDLVGQPLQTNVDIEIIQMVMGRLKASEDWRKPYRLEWDLATNHYEQVYDDTGKEDWQARTFQPMIPVHVERATASLHNMQMGPEVPVEYQARSFENEPKVNDANELVQHDLEKGNFKVHWTDFLRTLALYGTAIGKVGYDKKTETVMVKERKRSLFNGMFGGMARMFGFEGAQAEQEVFTPKQMLVKDFATFKNCDLYNIYPQPHITDFSKDTYVIEKSKITNRELVEGAMLEDEFYRLENVTPLMLQSGRSGINNDPETQEKRMTQMDTDVPMPFMDPDAEHELFEYWGPVPKWFLGPDLRTDEVQKYLTVNAWIWVVDGQWVVRKKINPYHDGEPPYVKGNFIRRIGQFYGIGIGKILAGLQIEKNEIRNTRQDNIELILQKVVAFLKDKVDPKEIDRIKSAPGAIWAFTGIDDIRKAVVPIDFSDITQDSWRGSAEVDREAQEATDVIKTTSTIGAGEDQAGNGTFRGQMLNRQQANERFMLYARMLEIMGLCAAVDKIYCRIYQFKSFEQIEKILGKARAAKFELVTPQEMGEIASIVSLGALTNENKGLKLAQMRDFYVLFEKEPWLKKLEYARKMYRMQGTGSDPDEILWTDQEVQTFNEQKRAMMAEMGGLPGGGMPGMPGGGEPGPGGPEGLSPNGLGSTPPGPVAGPDNMGEPGMPRPSMPPRGPGASAIDFAGRPAA